MVKLTIDSKEVEVPAGTGILLKGTALQTLAVFVL